MALLEASSDLENLRRLASDFRICGLYEEAALISQLIGNIPSYSPRMSTTLPTQLSDQEQAAADQFNLRNYSMVAVLVSGEETEISFCLLVNALLMSIEQDSILLPTADAKTQKTLRLSQLIGKVSISKLGSISCYLVGKAQELLGENAKAAESFKAAGILNSLNLPALLKLPPVSLNPKSWMTRLAAGLIGGDAKVVKEVASDFPNLKKLQLNLAKAVDRAEGEKVLAKLFADGLQGSLEGASLFSHILFLQRKTAELAKLARDCFELDRCSPETLKVLADHFALLGQRDKAILSLRKAAQITPKDASIWILLGHSFIELRNIPAAIHAYSKAKEISPDEPASNSSLAMAYDLLGQKSFAEYYLKKANQNN